MAKQAKENNETSVELNTLRKMHEMHGSSNSALNPADEVLLMEKGLRALWHGCAEQCSLQV